ncbi:MAG: transcriptional regulator [Stutzerimonas stutzeri]|nr:MAG: transcriptional regulator [Stutzerimonas stutzeri]
MSAPAKSNSLDKARLAWGDPLPEWVEALAEACNADTQAAVGRKLGYSGTAVSLVLSNKYGAGDMERFEGVVRGALMAETVPCPVLQDISRDRCLYWQGRPFSTASGNSVRMHQACRSGCPHSRLKAEGG